MKEVLSQEEVDALLANMANVPVTDTPLSRPAVDFDLLSSKTERADNWPGLSKVNERFSRGIAVAFSRILSARVEVASSTLVPQVHSEYMNALHVPCSLNLTALKPLSGKVLVVFDTELLTTLVDVFFGGDAGNRNFDGRSLSATEQRVVTRLFESITDELAVAWKPVVAVDVTRLACEENPSLVAISAPTEQLLRCRFSLQVARGGGVLDIVYPVSMLEPVRSELQQDRVAAVDVSPRWQQALAQGVSDAHVVTSCLLAETSMSVGDIAALDVGDVIPLGVQGRSLLTASGIPMFRGRIGVNAGNLALKIIADV